MPFLAGSFAYVISNMFMFKRSLPKRLAISLAVGSIAISGHHYVGQYGLQKNVNKIFDKIVDEKQIERGSQVAIQAKNFENELKSKL